MTVKLAPALPKDDKNGLATISGDLATRYYAGGHTTAIVVLESLGVNHEDGDRIPKVGIVRIEPLTDDLEDDALNLLQQAAERRLGRKPDTLNFDAETEFADIDGRPQLEAVVVDAEIVDGNPEDGDAA